MYLYAMTVIAIVIVSWEFLKKFFEIIELKQKGE